MIGRLEEILEFLGLTPSEFADEIEVQRSSMSHLFSGRNKPSLDFIKKIKLRYPEIDTDWLIFGEGNMVKNELKDDEENTPLPSSIDIENQKSDVNKDLSLFDEMVVEEEKEIKTIESVENVEQSKIENIQTAETKKINRIVIFYEDGTFESYLNSVIS